MERSRAIKELWRRGELRWKLHAGQIGVYESIAESTERRYVINCSRRIGKTFLVVTIAIETARQKPGAQIRYAAPTGKALKKIVLPIMRVVLRDCPEDMKPEWKASEGVYRFPNGSEIHLAGTDNGNAENLRGTAADLCIVDEAGFIDELDYLVKDILGPQLMYAPKGAKTIIASTPPRSPAHEFTTYLTEAEIKGAYSHRTIYDNPLLTEQEIEEFMEDAGGEDSTTWKREYLAQVVADATRAVVPEMKPEIEGLIVQEHKRPAFFNTSTVGDLGFNDATAFLFGYYDFDVAKVVIEDEFLVHSSGSRKISNEIKVREARLWPNRPEPERYADGELITLQDMGEHGVGISPVRKGPGSLEQGVNEVRKAVQGIQLVIHPRCTHLIAHLKYAIWNKQRTKFAKSDPDEFFHFDALAALVYFLRHVNRDNPYPDDLAANPHTQFIPPDVTDNSRKNQLVKAFGGRR